MDAVGHRDLLHVAEEYATAPLPDGWMSAQSSHGKTYYYQTTGEPNSTYKHPMHDFFLAKFQALSGSPPAAGEASPFRVTATSRAVCSLCGTSAPGMRCGGSHFICHSCLSAYVVAACEPDGDYQANVTNGRKDRSAPGQLPCPFFKAAPEFCTTCELKVETLMPVVDDTARAALFAAGQRVAIAQSLAAAREAEQAELHTRSQGPVGTVMAVVLRALELGQSVACPGCKEARLKDDQCMHMTCPCGTKFCYACGLRLEECGKLCDATSPFFESNPGWRQHDGSTALEQFHLKLMAFYVWVARELLPCDAWSQCVAEHPDLFKSVLGAGRDINVKALPNVPPLFGRRVTNKAARAEAVSHRRAYAVAALRKVPGFDVLTGPMAGAGGAPGGAYGRDSDGGESYADDFEEESSDDEVSPDVETYMHVTEVHDASDARAALEATGGDLSAAVAAAVTPAGGGSTAPPHRAPVELPPATFDGSEAAACRFLHNSCMSEGVTLGDLANLYAAMDAHPRPHVLQSGLAALEHLTVEPSNRETVFASGVEARVVAVCSSAQDPDVHFKGLNVLWNLTSDDATDMVSQLGVEFALDGLGRHPGHVDVQRSGFWMLSNLCISSPPMANVVAAGNGLAAVVGALRTHAETSRVTTPAVNLAIELCDNGYAGAAMAAGVLPLVDATAVTHAADADAVVRALKCFAALASHGPSAFAVADVVAARLPALMAAHQDTVAIQVAACVTLQRVCRQAAAAATVCKPDILDALAASAQAHMVGPTGGRVLDCVFRVASSMVHPDTVAAVVGSRIWGVLRAAMTQHAAVEAVQVSAMGAMATAIKAAVEAFTPEDMALVVDTMTRNVGNSAVVNGACIVLFELSMTRAGTAVAVSGGCLPPMFAACRAHIGDEAIRNCSMSALHNFLISTPDKSTCVAAGTLDFLRAVFTTDGIPPEVAAQALELASSTDPTGARLEADGWHRDMVALIRTGDDAGVAAAACAVLRTVAREHASAVVDAGALSALPLVDHAAVGPTVTAACELLRVLATEAAVAAVIVSGGALDSMLEACQVQNAAPEVLADALMVLERLSGHADLRLGIAAAALSAVDCALEAHSTDVKVVRVGLTTLARLAESEPVAGTVVTGGGLGKAIAAATACMASAEVQAAFLLFVGEATRWADLRRPVLEDGLPHILAAMEAHWGDEQVQNIACCVLANWSFEGSVGRAACAGGILPAMYAAVRAFPNGRPLVPNYMIVFNNLLGDADNNQAFVNSGGLPFLLNVLTTAATSSASVAKSCCSVVASTAIESETRTERGVLLCQAGCVPPLVALFKAHSGEADVVRDAARAVAYLTAHDANLSVLVMSCAHTALASTAKAHPADADLVQHCVRGLANMAAAHPVAVRDNGGVDVLLAAMGAHPGVASVQGHCCTGLARLAPVAADVVSRGLRPTMRALDRHVRSAQVQAGGCALLNAAASNPCNRATLVAEGAVATIQRALDTHRGHLQVAAFGEPALRLLR